MTSRLALSHTYCLDENLVETCCFAKDDGLSRLACHTAKTACRRAGANEGVRMYAKLLHSCLVAKDAALRSLAAWVDGKDSKATAIFFENMNAKLVYACALACARNAAYADANAVS